MSGLSCDEAFEEVDKYIKGVYDILKEEANKVHKKREAFDEVAKNRLLFFFLHGQIGVSYMCNDWKLVFRARMGLYRFISDLILENVPSLDQFGTAVRPLDRETGG